MNFVSKASAFPASVQPGHPEITRTPDGWIRAPIGQFLREVRRPVRMNDDQAFDLVTVKRARGGVVVREKLTEGKSR
jgi:type I restriction enzyme, S subunit